MRLKDRTLKNVYEQRERRVVTEAIDMTKVNAAAATVDKLTGLLPDGAAMFQAALKAAKADLQKYARGGVLQGLKNVLGDPLVKTDAMLGAVKAGFAALPGILKLNLPKGMENEGQKSCLELVPQETQKEFLATMQKAFAPAVGSGTLGGDIKGLFTNNNMPYISNLKAAIQELMQNVAPNGAYKLGQQAATIQVAAPEPADPAAAQADPAAATPAAGQAAAPATAGQAAPTPTAGTTAAAPTQGAKAAIPPTASKVAAPAAAAANKKLDPAADAQKINDIAYFLASQTGVDKEAAAKIIQALAKTKGLNDIPIPAQPSNKLAAGAVPAATPAKV